MAARDSSPSLADYVGIAIAPALIIALVCSLVYFLLEVLLGSDCPGQLKWILFFFVIGAVLVARISMTGEIAERAALYGVVLAVAVWLGMMKYVKYPESSNLASSDWLVNGVLIAIVWWSAHKLTRDSTLIDDDQDASGAGLIQEAGLDETVAVPPEPVADAGKNKKGQETGLGGWIHRYRRYRSEEGKRPHAPGIWIVYFSLAALPLFGLGQSLIPPSELERRQYAFWLMTIYVASGLSLLLSTSFLNMRRYLRQRNVRMPMSMTGVWLGVGGVLILLLLALGAFLPRPNAEYPLIDLGIQAASHEREGSKYALGEGWAKKGDEGRAGKRKGERDGGSGEKSDDAKTSDQGKGDGNNNSKNGEPKQGGGGKSGEKSGGKNSDRNGAKGNGPKGDRQQGKADAARSEPGKGEQETGEQNSAPDTPNLTPPSITDFLMRLIKWIVIALVCLVIVFVLGRALLRFLANFTTWAARLLKSLQDFWNRLSGLWQERLPEAILDEPERQLPPPPFAEFPDPFLTGQAGTMAPARLVRYAFDALDAWAYEHDLARQAGETPLEFAARLGEEHPALEAAALNVANLYAGVAYSGKPPVKARLEVLRPLWGLLQDVAEKPMSAGAVETHL